MEKTSIISVGIDIGTSTTQIIFSELVFDNTAGFFQIPQISIVDKKVIYKSEIYQTPLKSAVKIDGDVIREIVETEYQKAGFCPRDIGTGAVIITGESARKENSALILEKLSAFAGEFVVSTAGPDLEAIIAGKGSGARQYSKEQRCTVVNMDIGGGTTNIALFDCGEVIAKGCLDIGGRQIIVSPDNQIEYISESARKIARHKGLHLEKGRQVTVSQLAQVTDGMTELLEELLGLCPAGDLLRKVVTKGSSEFVVSKPIKAISFSGGVADCIFYPYKEPFPFGDIGVLLGESIRKSRLFQVFHVQKPEETIRATVIGAGNYTTTVSGSTISYSDNIFPLRNIPVLKLTEQEQKNCVNGITDELKARVEWFLAQSDSQQFVLALEGELNPSYTTIKQLAASLYTVLDEALNEASPILVIVTCDMAKALGQAMERQHRSKRKIAVIDSVVVEDNDYVDMGKPLMEGTAIPVVVKTLILG